MNSEARKFLRAEDLTEDISTTRKHLEKDAQRGGNPSWKSSDAGPPKPTGPHNYHQKRTLETAWSFPVAESRRERWGSVAPCQGRQAA